MCAVRCHLMIEGASEYMTTRSSKVQMKTAMRIEECGSDDGADKVLTPKALMGAMGQIVAKGHLLILHRSVSPTCNLSMSPISVSAVKDMNGNMRPVFAYRESVQTQPDFSETAAATTITTVLLFRCLIMICAESNHQRISFSSDLGQSDITPVEPPTHVRRDATLLDSSNSDFEFHISRNLDHESSPADEIFANGMILPILPFQITAAATVPKRLYKYELPPIVSTPSISPCPPPPPLPENPRKYSEKETTGGNGSGSSWDTEAEKSAKSFWSFKRSASLNRDIKKSLICSLPRLTRNNSTGSVANSKRAMLRDVNKHSSQRQREIPSSPSSSICCSVNQFRHQNLTGKTASGNGGGGGGGGGGSFRVNPLMVASSPFWLGSILRRRRTK